MKKIICILLSCTLLLLTSCGTNTSNNTPMTAVLTDLPAEMKIYCNDIFMDEYHEQDKNAIKTWRDYMFNSYQINIDFVQMSTGAQVVCMNGNQMLEAIKADKLTPLDEYLKESKVWMSLPQTFRSKFEYEGHIYAIPRSTNLNLPVSSIRTDWLKTVGKEIPTNPQTLQEVGKAFAEGDANGDGNPDNDYLIGENYAMCTDILNSFGIYTTTFYNSYNNNSFTTTLAYDPVLDCIVDGMFKPEAKEALQYLRDLYTSGLIDVDAFWGANRKNCLKGEYGLVQTNLGDAKFEISESYEALPPLSEKYPIAYSENNEGFVILKGTKDPGGLARAMVEMMFSSVEHYLEWSLGVPDTYTINSDKSITLKFADELIRQTYTKAGIIDCSDVILGDSYTVIKPDEDLKTVRDKDIQKAKYQQDYIDKYAKTGQLCQVPVWYSYIYSDLYYELYAAMSLVDAMKSLKEPQISIDSIIAEYKRGVIGIKTLQFASYSDYIKMKNKIIGKTLSIPIE